MFSLPRSIISRDISSGNSRKIFSFWVRPDNPSASNVCFILGPVQFLSVLGVGFVHVGELYNTVHTSIWLLKNYVSNIIKQHL